MATQLIPQIGETHGKSGASVTLLCIIRTEPAIVSTDLTRASKYKRLGTIGKSRHSDVFVS